MTMKLNKLALFILAAIVGIFLTSSAWPPSIRELHAASGETHDEAHVDEEDEEDEENKEEFCEDKGPDSIDVSKYPEEQQKNYNLFSKKCSKCHTLARPINTTELATVEDWTQYVLKMKKKKRSGIRKKDVAAITAFLIFDTKTRKKEILAQREKRIKEGKKGHVETPCKWDKEKEGD